MTIDARDNLGITQPAWVWNILCTACIHYQIDSSVRLFALVLDLPYNCHPACEVFLRDTEAFGDNLHVAVHLIRGAGLYVD